MKILPSLAEKMEFKGDQEQMRGGVPVFKQTSEQYGGLTVPFGLSTETHYGANQIQYDNTSMVGGAVGGGGDVDVIPDDTFRQLFDKVLDTKKSKIHGGKASKRTDARLITKKTKKQR